MKKKNQAYLLLLVLFSIPIALQAIPATPYPIQRVQPDGSELTVYLRGDEFFSYFLSEDGYLIKEDEKGYFTYIRQDIHGIQESTGVRVRPASLRSSEERQLTSTLQAFPDLQDVYRQRRAARVAQSNETGPSKAYPRTGSPKSLVILVNYSDVQFVTPNPKQAFTDLLNKEGYTENGGTGSARDYFRVASNGISAPEFVVVGPYTLPNNRAYYGGNNSSDDDQRPRDMVIDACNAAANAGVDFTIYDTDNDGVVDNVFVYYAGHNEAEGGPKETIWPHRWSLSTNLTLNGKRIIGYACTSELRGSSGNNMCGIGTFAHEFGHVYGLVDYYATNGANHHTTSYWNIMDAGAYLNSGRTPPTYSAYDRFYVGWLTPTLLKSAQDVHIPDIKTSNKAYIITNTDAHNLNGANPNPVEFITLEYRKRTGWDAFLPASGMLVTRIVYNSNDWRNNGPNNNAAAMGVDIIEADGIASSSTLPGDVFPGTSRVTSYNPTMRSGTDMNKPITYIKEENDGVSFRFMGGGNPPTINSSQNELQLFTTVLGQLPPEQTFSVSAFNLTSALELSFSFNKHFEIRRADDLNGNWSRTLSLNPSGGIIDTTKILLRYNPSEPSFNEIHYEYLLARSNDADTYQSAVSGKSTRPVYVTPPAAQDASISSLEGFQASWKKVFDASGYYLTVFSTSDGTSELKEGFDKGLALSSDWNAEAESTINNPAYAGDSIPSIEFRKTGDFIETELYPISVATFRFFIRSIGENTGFIKVEAHDGSNWSTIDNLPVSYTLRTVKEYPIINTAQRKFKITFSKGTSTVAIDDVGVSFNKQLAFLYKDHWVTDTTFTVKGIIPSSVYHFKVKASDRTLYPNNELKYENITEFSNTVEVQLANANILQYCSENSGLMVFTDNGGTVQLAITETTLKGEKLYVYNTSGRLMEVIDLESDIVSLNHLKKGSFYILKSLNGAIKVVL